ncbi:MAG: tripartite tricarboxylate transporter TctB family protein [Acidobacteria bacterium]|nr:tripartite tricarboxylate transporter TctB family protein [Acidobacteriota bacterium]
MKSAVDRWLGPSLTVLALVWLWLVYAYIPGARFEGEPGPRAFPVLLGVVLAGLGVVMSLQALMSVGRERSADATPVLTGREAWLAIGTFGLLILYAFLLDKIGFIVATPVVIATAMYGLAQVRRWVLIGSLAIGITLGCWVIFDALLGTPLPSGSWVVWP